MFLDRLRNLLGGWSQSRRLQVRHRALRRDFLRTIPLQIESLEDRRLLAVVTWDGDAGTLNWNDPTNWSGNNLPGSTDDVSIDIAGTNTVTSTSFVSIRSLVSEEALAITPNATFTIAQASALNAGLQLSGGTLTANGTITLSGLSSWTGGTIAGLGTVRNTGTLARSGAGAVSVSGNFANAGTINHTATGDVTVTGTFTNETGALYDIATNTGRFQTNGGAGSYTVNQGTIRRSAGTGTFNLDTGTVGTLTLQNNGLIQVQTGTVTMTGADQSTSTGTYDVSGGATLALSNGAHAYGAGAAFTGAGTVQFNGASPGFTFNADVTATANVSLGGGAISPSPAARHSPGAAAPVLGQAVRLGARAR